MTGGIRSGKSRWAEKLVSQIDNVIYIATAQVWDEEMAKRIKLHRVNRPPTWQTIEEPYNITQIINEFGRVDRPPAILVDCLTLWVTNLLLNEYNIELEFQEFKRAIAEYGGTLVMVSNEVGLGGVSINQLTRNFTDVIGLLHQQLADICTRVYFVACGFALDIKNLGERV